MYKNVYFGLSRKIWKSFFKNIFLWKQVKYSKIDFLSTDATKFHDWTMIEIRNILSANQQKLPNFPISYSKFDQRPTCWMF